MAREASPVTPATVAEIGIADIPVLVGVPEIRPVVEFMVNPEGRFKAPYVFVAFAVVAS